MSNSRNIAVGTVTGTGADINVSVGFAPAYVYVLNLSGLAQMHWFDGMDADHSAKSVTAGTLSEVTSDGIIPYAGSTSASEGFTIQNDSDINVDTEVMYYMAVGKD